MFLQKVYRQWKAFFWFIIAALFLQVFFMLKGVETIPFFLYHMFSYAHLPKDSVNIVLIRTPSGYINTTKLSNRESEMLLNNVPYYNVMKKNGWKDPVAITVETRFENLLPGQYLTLQQQLANDSTDFMRYPQWWQRYFRQVWSMRVDSFSVVFSYMRYDPLFSKSDRDSIIFSGKLK